MDPENIILDTDSYKLSHFLQYPDKTRRLFAYLESRGGRYGKTVFFGLQPILAKLTNGVTPLDVEEAADLAKQHGEPFPLDGWMYVAKELGGRIPLHIRAVPEGSVVPVRNALMTVESTDDKVPWMTTWFETQLMRVWYPTTVCTKSYHCVKTILEFLKETSEDPWGELPFKLHDFGARGVSSQESAGMGGAAHLVNSVGTDTLMGIIYAQRYYQADKMPGFSIPAMEHSTVTSWGRHGERAAFANMIAKHKDFPILACVSDSYDVDNAVENIWGDDLLDLVKASGKLIVIRPDSGPPAETTVRLLQILERKVGMHVNSKGYKVLPKFYRLIWPDGNKSEDDIREILMAMMAHRFSASNIAFGMGGGLLQLVDRDTQMFAYKTSAALIGDEWVDVKKEPKTDAHKVSKAGRLDLVKKEDQWKTAPLGDKPKLTESELDTVFANGKRVATYRFDDIRARAAKAMREEV